MDTVVRSLSVYVILLVIFRLAGKRAVSEITTFDFVLLLIISEATQQALVGEDTSITSAVIVIVTLILADIGFSLLKRHWRGFDVFFEGRPLILVEDGKVFEERLRKSRVDREDILMAARESQGVGTIDEIRYAVLEPHGGISIIPWEPSARRASARSP